MPQFHLTDQELNDLAAFLEWTSASTPRAGRPTRRAEGAQRMKYPSQKVAYVYFAGALALFAVQILFGALSATVYVLPNFLADLVPFNILRMIHTNALIVWLLMGFFGAAYYLVPEEAEREIESPLLAYIQFALLMFGALAAVVGYLFGIHEGREFLEQPLWIKLAIVVVALIFLYNICMTVLHGRRTAITNVLLMGMVGIAVFWLFALYDPGNLVARQAVLVVRHPSLGRGRLGAGDGRHPGLHGHQDDRR